MTKLVAASGRTTTSGGRLAVLWLCLAFCLAAFGCDETSTPAADPSERPPSSEAPASGTARAPSGPGRDTPRPARERELFFGDLHVHSSWSIDAFDAGVRAGPEQAYRYALGEAIPHASGTPIQLAGPPLDFMALTDHAEYLGVIAATQAPVHPLHELGLFRRWMGNDPIASDAAWREIDRSFRQRRALPALGSNEVVAPAWREIVELADRYDEPGTFTAFVGFEYTSNPEFQNLHRNVIFRGSNVPDRPFSAMDSPDPEALWRWMDRVRPLGDDLIAIPHNSNGSNGLMFARTRFDGSPIDRSWIDQRVRNEPLVEVMQIKGQSETRPVLSPNDEWADFEVAPWRTLNPALASRPRGSYVRDALLEGMRFEASHGRNPYALGMIGSTDGHNAASPFEERNYTGKIGRSDATPARRLAGTTPPERARNPYANVSVFWSAAGLAGIWAEANTRGDLFDAMRRRETFSTSGPRIRVRFFGGWDYRRDEAGGDLVGAGYAKGVPMGGRLEAPGDAIGPSFLLAAAKDPLEADLERIQIIKGWIADGEAHERVFDVACARGAAPDPERHRCLDGASAPDLESCAPEAGAAELRAWWRDPEFDASERAFYYVRVLQVPTCRWSTFDAKRLGLPPPRVVPPTIQERAVTSPIWYTPS